MLRPDNLIIINDPNLIPKYFEKERDIVREVGNTLELNNVILTYKEVAKPSKSLPTKTDEEERDWLYKEIDYAILKLEKDRNTRQAIVYNLHDSGLDHNCLNLFHFYFREDCLHLNVYVRSMNYDANFENDLYTINILLNKACNELMCDKGQMVVFIMSLHRFK